MTKHEARFQVIFKHWVFSKFRLGDMRSSAFELKRTLTHRLPYSAVKVHQNIALEGAAGDGVYHKISDASYEQKPFDCFVLVSAEAYVVIAFGKQVTDFILIPVAAWADIVRVSADKSITYEEALMIGECVNLKSNKNSVES